MHVLVPVLGNKEVFLQSLVFAVILYNLKDPCFACLYPAALLRTLYLVQLIVVQQHAYLLLKALLAECMTAGVSIAVEFRFHLRVHWECFVAYGAPEVILH